MYSDKCSQQPESQSQESSAHPLTALLVPTPHPGLLSKSVRIWMITCCRVQPLIYSQKWLGQKWQVVPPWSGRSQSGRSKNDRSPSPKCGRSQSGRSPGRTTRSQGTQVYKDGGRRYFLTVMRSVTLDNIDVTETGRSSDKWLGFVTFGRGVTSACFQWLGGLPEVMVMVK